MPPRAGSPIRTAPSTTSSCRTAFPAIRSRCTLPPAATGTRRCVPPTAPKSPLPTWAPPQIAGSTLPACPTASSHSPAPAMAPPPHRAPINRRPSLCLPLPWPSPSQTPPPCRTPTAYRGRPRLRVHCPSRPLSLLRSTSVRPLSSVHWPLSSGVLWSVVLWSRGLSPALRPLASGPWSRGPVAHHCYFPSARSDFQYSYFDFAFFAPPCHKQGLV